MQAQLQVLVVDDEPIVCKRVKSSLAKMGCTVEAVADPREAFERIEGKEYDVIVTDILMGELDGIHVLERAGKKSPRTKVILITGYAMMEMARRAMEKGAYDFIAKPFNPAELRAAVARAAAELGIEVTAVDSEAGE